VQDEVWPVQKMQELQGELPFNCGLQTSLSTSLHGLHLSCKRVRVCENMTLLKVVYLSYSNPQLVRCSLWSLEVIPDPVVM
jgi:hypothetical protein